jgi:hypothetical protein
MLRLRIRESNYLLYRNFLDIHPLEDKLDKFSVYSSSFTERPRVSEKTTLALELINKSLGRGYRLRIVLIRQLRLCLGLIFFKSR